ncbi:hypothetical protein C8T65DRAFT_18835 [Cerioporus squamosus]|nr:hypothetical protein C8T65DRAFT_18835 [Cerioporus squamosus]
MLEQPKQPPLLVQAAPRPLNPSSAPPLSHRVPPPLLCPLTNDTARGTACLPSCPDRAACLAVDLPVKSAACHPPTCSPPTRTASEDQRANDDGEAATAPYLQEASMYLGPC